MKSPHTYAIDGPWFRALPIRRKLMFALLFTATTALLLAGLGIVASDSFLFYGYLQRDLLTLSRIIADRGTAPLAFDDAKSARELLTTLRAREHVDVACLYRTDGSLLALYSRDPSTPTCPPLRKAQGVVSSAKGLEIYQAVLLDGRSVGTLVIQYDLDELSQRLWLYGSLVIGVLAVSSLFAVLLSTRLRTVIASPILELTASATSVSETKDYSIRARFQTPDEVGTLVIAFNEMLASMESREGELRNALDDQRAARTQLEGVNVDLQRSIADLARTNKDLEQFAFIASHDLQEPLRMITSYSQLLVKQYPAGSDGQQAVYTQRIVDGTKRMRELLSDLLAYAEVSAIPAGSGHETDLKETVTKVLDNLRLTIEDSGAVFTMDELPTLNADEGQLISLFQNLIENAIKYRSKQAPRIHIAATVEKGSFIFGVEDNGTGIDPQFHTTIFTVFKRLHGKDIPGTGIGLAICQRIVDHYDGRIWVESRAGGGTIFRFTLPKANAVPTRKVYT